ncbi:protein sidekick-like isoform X2 [Tachypleus tridentatus]|uniref:protein sidekick-like isoform X2 n=1 Tax=Tachypleus tridentatus TaxID=6853 RepID=UPI003FD2552B
MCDYETKIVMRDSSTCIHEKKTKSWIIILCMCVLSDVEYVKQCLRESNQESKIGSVIFSKIHSNTMTRLTLYGFSVLWSTVYKFICLVLDFYFYVAVKTRKQWTNIHIGIIVSVFDIFSYEKDGQNLTSPVIDKPNKQIYFSIRRLLRVLLTFIIVIVVVRPAAAVVTPLSGRQSAPRFVLQSSPGDGVVIAGLSKIFHCHAVGFPPPEYLWLKNGIPLGNVSSDPFLRISSVTREDAGNYQCIAQNTAGAIISKCLPLTVAYIIHLVRKNVTLVIQQGEAANLIPPNVESIPKPSVWWQKVGHGRLNDQKSVTTAENRLVILSSEPSDSGEYHVIFTNPHTGESFIGKTYNLEVTGIQPVEVTYPEFVIRPQNSIFQEGVYPAVLDCVVNARPLEDLQILWKKDGQYLYATGLQYFLSAQNQSLTLLNVGPQHEGLYECIAHFKGQNHFYSVTASANVTVHVPPLLTSFPDRETVQELYHPITLQCAASGKPTPNITWLKNAKPLTLDISVSRYEQLTNGALRILSVQRKDFGIFQCLATNAAGTVSASTWLHFRASSPFLVKSPNNLMVMDGNDVKLSCEATGAPVPNTTWILNDTTILENVGRVHIFPSGNLFIGNVQAEDTGEYKCIRENRAGSVSASAFLFVLVHTKIIQPPVDTQVILSSTGRLSCKVSHDPSIPFTTTWYVNNRELAIHPSGRFHILKDGTLEIRHVHNTDIGTYTCSVVSPGGNETRSAKLDVIELPHQPHNVKAELLHNARHSVNVSWSKGFDGNSPITKYIIQLRKLPEDGHLSALVPWVTVRTDIRSYQTYAILNQLLPFSSYQFRVSAVNGVGEGSPSSATRVIAIPAQVPSGPPQSVAGVAVSSTSIRVQWQLPREENINGELLGFVIRYRLAGYKSVMWSFENITHNIQFSFLLEDLIIWKRYEIQVSSYNQMGVGVYSDSIFIRTLEDVPQAAPTRVRGEAVNSTAIIIYWLPPDPQLINGINQGYKVEVWRNSSLDENVLYQGLLVPPDPLKPLDQQTAVVTKLQKFTWYNVTVLCFTSVGNGPSGGPIEVMTLEDRPGNVENLRFEDILDRSVKVLWSSPSQVNGILTGYTLKYHVKTSPESTTVVHNFTEKVTEVVIHNLKPQTVYFFEVFAWTQVGPGLSQTATIQSGVTPELPSVPLNLTITNIGATSVIIHFVPGFNGNSDITIWTVEAQMPYRKQNWTTVYETSDSSATSLTVFGLVPFTKYRLRLIARNVVGPSTPSEATEVFQTIQAPPAHAPYNATARALNATAIRVRWTPLKLEEWNGIPRGYNISFHPYLNSLQGFSFIILNDHNKNSYILQGLEEYTAYEVYMTAFNDVGTSQKSDISVEMTRESVPSAGPVNVTANVTSSSSVNVTWGEIPISHQNGILHGFKVFYRSESGPFQHHLVEDNDTYTATLTKLQKYTVYLIQVLGYTYLGDGSLSSPPVTVQTFQDVPGPPSNVSFPDVTATSARIIWDVPKEANGEILAYLVTYKKNSSSNAVVTEFPPTKRTFRVYNLVRDTYYLFTVIAKTKIGWGKEKRVLVLTTNNREPPQASTKPLISSSQIQARHITFTWTPGSNGQAPLRYYTIQAMKDIGPWETVAMNVDPTVTTYTVSGLVPFTNYSFRIQATNDVGSSDWSPASNQAQTLPSAPFDAPTSVKVTPYTQTSVLVEWKALQDTSWGGDIQNGGYKIQYCQASDQNSASDSISCPIETSYGINETSVSLENLERDTIYKIKIYTFNSQGEGPSSRPVSVYVGEAVPTGSPSHVQSMVISSTEIEVSWKAPNKSKQNGDLLGYKISYREKKQSVQEGHIEVLPSSTNQLFISELKKYTQYVIQVLAFNPAGDGPWSKPITVRTKEDVPGPPGQLIFSDITMNSLNLSWSEPQEPNGKICGYLVTYETVTSNKQEYSKKVKQKVDKTSMFISGLREMTRYLFQVKAETIKYGPETVGKVTTGPQQGSPHPPHDLILSNTGTSVVLEWKNGLPGNAPISGYIIQARQKDAEHFDWQTVVVLKNKEQSSYTLSYQNLIPSAQYQLRVLAQNDFGISDPAISDLLITPARFSAEGLDSRPFYRKPWFLVTVASTTIIVIVLVIAVLYVKSRNYSFKGDIMGSLPESQGSIDDGEFATFELQQSQHGTLHKKPLAGKGNVIVVAKSPPRPSPAGIRYSDEDDRIDENSSLTEKPVDVSYSDSQATGSDSEGEPTPHSFVNHYIDVNNVSYLSWKRQKPVRPPSITESESEGNAVVSLNGGQVLMNNSARSRAPLLGLSSFI